MSNRRRQAPVDRSHRRALFAVSIVLFLAGAVSVYVVGGRTHVVTVDEALERFRASQVAGPGTVAGGLRATSTGDAATDEAGAGVADIATEAVAPPLAEPTAAPNESDPAADAPPASTAASSSDATDAATPAPAVAPGGDPVPARPAEGVYVYDTTGQERVQILRHTNTYPDQTTYTIEHTDCGSDIRWSVFEERYDVHRVCSGPLPAAATTLSPTGDGAAPPDPATVRVRQFETFHEFFGVREHRFFDCETDAWILPPDPQVGSRTASRCVEGDDDTTVALTTTVLARGTTTVGGTEVGTITVRVDEVLEGDIDGTRTTTLVSRVSDGLPVRVTHESDFVINAAVGRTGYQEQFDLRLTSLTPLT